MKSFSLLWLKVVPLVNEIIFICLECLVSTFLKISRHSNVFRSFGKKFHTVGPLYRRDNLPTSMLGRITFSLLLLVLLAVSFPKRFAKRGSVAL